ncbi:MAG: N-acetylmuramoyl-L-alanine amidase, partial [bacterium]
MRIFGPSAVVFVCMVSLLSGKWSQSISLAAAVPSGPQGVAKEEEKAGRPLLQQIRHISSDSYSRVIMDLSAEVRYETHILREDPLKDLPPRIYVDLHGARLAMDAVQPIVLQDRLLRQVRVGQFSPEVVRVVLDMKSLRDHKAFLLPDPYRLVIDVQGDGERTVGPPLAKGKGAPPAKKVVPAGLRKIVLDPGHGGKDTGAIGVGGLTEKRIVLSLARKLAVKLRKEMGVEVVLTRKNDSFLHLEDRTAIANAENADLFVSLHTNASPNRRARGIETYYLDNADDEGSRRLAARENGVSRRNVSDLQFILSDLVQNHKLEDSVALAHHLQSSLVHQIAQRDGGVR